jgi:DNA topoisomerase-1
MDLAFTRHMEEQLDKIEEQHLDWIKVLEEFYGPFKENLEKAADEMKHAKAQTEPSEYTCPNVVRR